MTRIKICGLRTPADIAAANESRPDYIGFILSPGYRRSITKEQALALRKQLDPGIVPVGVFVNATPAYIQACVDCGAIDAVQFHGQESPADCAAVHGAKKIKVFVTGEDQPAPPGSDPVDYLLFDSEPHSDDYSAYNTASLVHCVLFQEEQAVYLAGYAAVTDGYTTLGFIGAQEIPGIVRYCTGFLQGAEAAAELQGEYVTLQTWFTDTYENNDAITQRMIDWYNNGTSLIMVSGGNLYEGASGAVNQTGGKAITTDYDNTELGDRVLGSAIKCYNAAVQRQLYTFFAAGTWNGQTGGQTEKAGFTNGEVALEAGAPWRFDSFTQDDYRTLYEDLRTSVLKVDAYSDLDTLPDTPNVTVNRLL